MLSIHLKLRDEDNTSDGFETYYLIWQQHSVTLQGVALMQLACTYVWNISIFVKLNWYNVFFIKKKTYLHIFSGSIPSKVLRFLDHMNVAAISSSTFQNHQKYYLHPSISSVWTNVYFWSQVKGNIFLILNCKEDMYT
jgi:hypothetical protein